LRKVKFRPMLRSMTTDEILILARVYGAHERITLGTVGRRACRNNLVFRRLSDGGGANTRTIAQASDWFAANWPADLPWPSDIRRPEVTQASAPQHRREFTRGSSTCL